jgi:hypothetical protein
MKQFCRIKTMAVLLQRTLTLGAVLFTLSGASVWEGAAALAPRGELPEDGYYAATNSFPQNTVVDITNLETGKSVRAVVASGLNTPGLLAILSPDTASRIGLSLKTIGRIRMIQPEDPIAFSRFTEGLAASGAPDYDPEAMLAGDAREMEEAEAERNSPLRTGRGVEAPKPPPPEAPGYGYEIPKGVEYSEYADYSHGSIVDLRPNSTPSAGQEPQFPDDREADWDERAYSGYMPEDEESVESTNYRIWEQGGSVGQVAAPQTPSDPWADVWRTPEGPRVQGEVPPQGALFAAEAQSQANSSGSESRAGARILIQSPPVPPPSGTVEYELIPTEDRPPVGNRDPEAQPSGESLDQSLFIDSLEKQRERAAEEARTAEAAKAAETARAEAARIAEEAKAAEAAKSETRVLLPAEKEEPLGPWVEPLEEAPPPEQPEVLVQIPEEKGEPPGPWVNPPASREPSPRIPGPEDPVRGLFSVPVKVITELEGGKYYVQLGAYRNPATVESALLKLDPGYPLNVQTGGTADNPLYRLLVGPLNLGESGALVRRFKGSGYRDAYVRSR